MIKLACNKKKHWPFWLVGTITIIVRQDVWYTWIECVVIGLLCSRVQFHKFSTVFGHLITVVYNQFREKSWCNFLARLLSKKNEKKMSLHYYFCSFFCCVGLIFMKLTCNSLSISRHLNECFSSFSCSLPSYSAHESSKVLERIMSTLKPSQQW